MIPVKNFELVPVKKKIYFLSGPQPGKLIFPARFLIKNDGIFTDPGPVNYVPAPLSSLA